MRTRYTHHQLKDYAQKAFERSKLTGKDPVPHLPEAIRMIQKVAPHLLPMELGRAAKYLMEMQQISRNKEKGRWRP